MAASACVDRADIEAQLGASSSADEPEIVFREIRHADIAELKQLQRVLFPVQYSDTFYQRLFTDGYYTIVGVTVPDGELVAVASVRTVQHSDEVRDSGLREVWPAVRTAFTSLVPVSSQQPPRSRAGVHYDAGRQGAPLRPTPSLRSASTMVSSSPTVAGDVPTAAARDACDAGVPRSDTRASAMRRAPHHAPRSSERACAWADPRLMPCMPPARRWPCYTSSRTTTAPLSSTSGAHHACPPHTLPSPAHSPSPPWRVALARRYGFSVDPDGFCKDHYLIDGVLCATQPHAPASPASAPLRSPHRPRAPTDPPSPGRIAAYLPRPAPCAGTMHTACLTYCRSRSPPPSSLTCRGAQSSNVARFREYCVPVRAGPQILSGLTILCRHVA